MSFTLDNDNSAQIIESNVDNVYGQNKDIANLTGDAAITQSDFEDLENSIILDDEHDGRIDDNQNVGVEIESLKNRIAEAKENIDRVKNPDLPTKKTFPLLGRIFGGLMAAAATVAAILVATATLPVSLPLGLGIGAAFLAGSSLFGVAQHAHNKEMQATLHKNVVDVDEKEYLEEQETTIKSLTEELYKKEAIFHDPTAYDTKSRLDAYNNLNGNFANPQDKIDALLNTKYPDSGIKLKSDVPYMELNKEPIEYTGDGPIEFDQQLSQKELDIFLLQSEYNIHKNNDQHLTNFNKDIGRNNLTINQQSYTHREDVEAANNSMLGLANGDEEIALVLKGLANQTGCSFPIMKTNMMFIPRIGSVKNNTTQIAVTKTESNLENVEQYQINYSLTGKMDTFKGEFTDKNLEGDYNFNLKLNLNVKKLNNGQKEFYITLAEPMVNKISIRPKENLLS